jgi:hypothetical protein
MLIFLPARTSQKKMAKNKKTPGSKRGQNMDFLSKCTFCGADYEADDLTVLEEMEQKTTLHVTCGQCLTAAIFFLSNNQSGIVSLGMATDLDKEEVRQKFSRTVVSADEVIDVHQMVEKGDINQFLQSN